MNKNDAAQYLPLVQALADGKTLQSNVSGTWDDIDEPLFQNSPTTYRIKPEPREIWVSHARGGNFVVFESEYQVEKYNDALGEVRRYREVLE